MPRPSNTSSTDTPSRNPLSERSTGPTQPATIRRPVAAALLVGSLAVFGLGAYLYAANAPHLRIFHIALEHPAASWPKHADLHAALRWNFVLIGVCGAGLLSAVLLGGRVFWTRFAQRAARAAFGLSVAGLLAYVAADALLLTVADPSTGAGSPAGFSSAATMQLNAVTAMTVLTVCCLAPAVVVAVFAAITTGARLVWNSKAKVEGRPEIPSIPPLPLEGNDAVEWPGNKPPIGIADVRRQRWLRGFVVPGLSRPEEIEEHVRLDTQQVGFCVSGGGVRSASVALGALDVLRKELLGARYLVSVSGGGYLAGSMQLALAKRDPAKATRKLEHVSDPGTTHQAGSVEEDYVRRNINYLAETPGQMLVALGVVGRALLVSLTVLFGTAAVLGVAAGQMYQYAQIANWNPGSMNPANRPTYPTVRIGTAMLIGGLAVLAFLLYVAGLYINGRRYSKRLRRLLELLGAPKEGAWQWPGKAALGITLVTVLVTVLAVGVPSVVYGAAWVLRSSHVGGATIGGSVGSVLLAYVATLRMLGKRATVGGRVRSLVSGKGSGVIPTGALQPLLVIATLVVLAACWVLLFGGMAAIANEDAALVAAGSTAFVLVFMSGVVDQSSLSLHPFYRRRLSNAFAVRRMRRTDDDLLVAAGYPYGERTNLSDYAPYVPGYFPEVIFAAAANLTGEQRAPLNAASFTFSGEWIGGPDVGYMRTNQLEEAVSPQLAGDLTVEGAVAISGAAVASAMGRASRWYGTLLAVTGARLGAWLPNPGFVDVHRSAKKLDNWTVPGIPRLRRLTYLVREVLGLHNCTDRLLQITDGGHYENLGLVELLRRRCTTIYCVDASGDSPPTAGTLSNAIALAYEELGVRIELHDEWKLVPGSGEALDPKDPLAALNGRLSASAAIVGDITYPPESGITDEARRSGRLIFIKATLTRDMAYDVLSYAARNPVFPNDSTGDQFFNDDKYTAYTGLGREIAAQAQRVLNPPLPPLPKQRRWSFAAKAPRGEVQVTVTREPDNAIPVIAPANGRRRRRRRQLRP